MCTVLNKRMHGMPAGAEYIGRGSKWGNRFVIGRDGDRATVIAKHECDLVDRHDLLRALDELRGRDLVCFCAPLSCHGDLLFRLANATRDERIAWWRGVKAFWPRKTRTIEEIISANGVPLPIVQHVDVKR